MATPLLPRLSHLAPIGMVLPPLPDVSVIIVNWNTRDLLAACLRSIRRTAGGLQVEIVVVDNASTDDSPALVQTRFPDVRLICNQENVGFARANNEGFAASHGRYVLLLNSDARLLPNSLQSLVQVLDTMPAVGLVGAQLRNADGSFQASHTPFPGLWQEFLILSTLGRRLQGPWYPSRGPQDCEGPQLGDYVEGACMLVRREAYEAVGGLDEAYFMYAEDVELCFAIKAQGWQVCYQPAALVMHVGSASSQNRRPERESDLYCSRVRFFHRHYGRWAAHWLIAMILTFTVVKSLGHRFLRLISHGRYGRPVVPLQRLATGLRHA